MHGIAYDPERDEIIVPNPLASAILVFRGGARGEEAPIRVIQGPRTKLIVPRSLALDLRNKEILVADKRGRAVLVFSKDAKGDVPPLRVIQGPKTKLDNPIGLAVDPVTDSLVVANLPRLSSNAQPGLFIFKRTDNGDIAPRAVIAGPKTGIIAEPWQTHIYGGRIFTAVANVPRFRLYKLLEPEKASSGDLDLPQWRSDILGFIGVWNITDNGDIPPRAMIRGPVSGLVHPSGLALNTRDGEIMTTDSVRNGVFTFLMPELFRESN